MEALAQAEVQEGHTRMHRVKLLEELRKNRETHTKEYESAIQGWVEEYAKALDAHAEKTKALADKARSSQGVLHNLKFDYPDLPERPEDHTKDYDKIIRRMEFSIDAEIFLTHRDFDRYVQDEWAWKVAHTEALANYSQIVR